MVAEQDDTLLPLRRFRLAAVRYTLFLTVALSAVAYPFSPVVSQGLLLGGIAGALGFWIVAKRVEKLALAAGGKVQSSVLAWSVFRFGLYGAVLFKAYTLDTEMFGLLGALAGIFIMHFVLIFLGVTGIDLPRPKAGDESGES